MRLVVKDPLKYDNYKIYEKNICIILKFAHMLKAIRFACSSLKGVAVVIVVVAVVALSGN